MDRPRWLEAAEAAVEQSLSQEGVRLATLARQGRLWFGCCTYLLDGHKADDYPEPVLECVTDAIESLSLATHAYYQSAISTLRRQLELAVLSVLFRSDEGLGRRYMRNEKMDSFPNLARRAFNLREFRDYDEAMRDKGLVDLASQVDYKRVCSFWGAPLSAVVHGAFAMWNMTNWDYGPTPQYSREAFDIWGDSYEATQHMCLLWVLLAHRGMFRSIEQRNPQEWSVLFDPVQTTYLAKVDGAARNP